MQGDVLIYIEQLQCICAEALSDVRPASELSAETASCHCVASRRPTHHCWETVSTNETRGIGIDSFALLHLLSSGCHFCFDTVG